MKKNKNGILDSLDSVDPELIAEADTFTPAKKKNTAVRWVSAAACLGLVTVLSIGTLTRLQKTPDLIAADRVDPGEPDYVTEDPTEPQAPVQEAPEVPGPAEEEPASESKPDVSQTDSKPRPDGEPERPSSTESPDPEPPADPTPSEEAIWLSENGLTDWENRRVSTALAEAMKNPDGDRVYEIEAVPSVDYFFVYEGKELGDYYTEMWDERNLPDILQQLIKEGDSLKYGESLCTEGDADGIRWDRALYEERIAFYGEKILSTYLVDGEFLRDKLEEDIETARKAKAATIAYKTAYAAYWQNLIDTLQVTVPVDTKGTDRLVLHMTADEFRRFMPSTGFGGWTFYLAGAETQDDDWVSDEGIPTAAYETVAD